MTNMGMNPAQIVFYYPSYKNGKDAYTIKFIKGDTEFHKLYIEKELWKRSKCKSMSF